MTSPVRVLGIRLDTIGDVLMTTPALGAMADSGAEVTLLTSSYSASLTGMLPYLVDVVTLDVPWMKPAERRLVPAAEHLSTLSRLAERSFDLAVVFTVSTQDPACGAYLAYLCGVRRVAAYVRGKLYGLVTDPVQDQDEWPPSRHEVTRQLDLAAALGFPARSSALRVAVPPPSGEVVEVLGGLEREAWTLVHPGATAQSRRYPPELWAQVVDELAAQGVRVVLAGGRQDRLRCDRIARLARATPLPVYARLALPDLAALIARAPVALTCNSSAAHLAAAVGTPVVTLYAGTNPQHTPWTRDSVVLRRHTDCTWCLSSMCRRRVPACIASIPPARVADAALQRLSKASAPSPAEDLPRHVALW